MAGVLACAMAALGGCGSGGPVASGEAYVGAPVEISESGRTYTVVYDAPTPGWTMELVSTRQLYKRVEVFVLLRRPNPIYLYPQQVVRQHLATEVRPDLPMDLYVAVVHFGDKRETGPFALAASAAGTDADGAAPGPKAPGGSTTTKDRK